MKKLTVFAMTEKGYGVVRALVATYPEIIGAVISSRDAAIQKDYFDEIKDLCVEHGIRFQNRTDSFIIDTTYIMTISWRWLIKGANGLRIIVFHDSLLPKYRGFNPLVTSLINGDTEIGVTAIYATAEYDRGDIIGQSSSRIQYPIKIQQAFEVIQRNFNELALQIASCLQRDIEPTARPQDEALVSYSLWRDEEDYFIDWRLSATCIKRMIDAVGHPYKGAAVLLDGKVVRILEAKVIEDVNINNRAEGKVLFVTNGKPVVVCGTGLLMIEEGIDEVSRSSIFPLKKFRSRFKSIV